MGNVFTTIKKNVGKKEKFLKINLFNFVRFYYYNT